MSSRLEAGVLCVALVLGGCSQIFDLDHPAERGGIDAPGRDARSDTLIVDVMNDRDGDGVMDPADNCPDDFNPDQGNEDTDLLGDPCDPCPVDTNNADGDSDGVGDMCDPFPNLPGDQLALFEGFHNGMPSGWMVNGTWTAAGDSVLAAPGVNGFADVYIPSPSAHETVSVGGVMTSALGTDYRTFGVQENAEPATNGFAIVGALLITAASDAVPNTAMVDLFKLPSQAALKRTSYAWSVGDELRLWLTRRDSAYVLLGEDITAGTSKVVMGSDGTTTANPHLGFHVYSASARFEWLMVVTSP